MFGPDLGPSGVEGEAQLTLPPSVPPGVHWLRVVAIVGLQHAYVRLPITVLCGSDHAAGPVAPLDAET